MCAHHTSVSKKMNPAILYLIAITLGVASGLSDFGALHKAGLLISDIFIKIFKLISLPIIALSIIVTLSQFNAGENKLIGQKTLLYTISTTLVAAGIAMVLYLLISPGNVALVDIQSSTQLANISQGNYLDYLTQLIPENILSPFLEHQVLGVLLVSLITGIAIRSIPDQKAKEMTALFFKGMHGIFLNITSWVVKIIPIALYGFITSAAIQLKGGMNLSALGGYLTIIVLANLVQGLIILPAFLYMKGIKPFKGLRIMAPALSVAFFSKSSAGTLPVTMETAENKWDISSKTSRFVLPLCTSINMNGCAAFIFTTVIYLMQNNGVDLSFTTMLLWIFIATLAAVGNAGVPMGCFFLSISLLSTMNVPITLMALILPLYSLIDMLETALNVWSDSCVAKVVDQKVKNTSEEAVTESAYD